jgi:2-(1,2-epoxy-1,2-dihydrophenyl)acetyl-CoA isomerase
MTPFGEHVRYETRGGAGWIVLDRPERLNAFAGSMRDDLHRTLLHAAADDAVRVVVVTGAGRAFCAGADVDRVEALLRTGDEEEFNRNVATGSRVVLEIRRMEKLVIAAVNGVAAGAGASLAAACDLRIASADARIGFTFTRVGLHPDWGASFTLPRLVGHARAAELIHSARMLDAGEALAAGLVDRVVPPAELASRASEWAGELAGTAPKAQAAAKRTFTGDLDLLGAALAREAEAQLLCFRSGEALEGIAAFRERRRPSFGTSDG